MINWKNLYYGKTGPERTIIVVFKYWKCFHLEAESRTNIMNSLLSKENLSSMISNIYKFEAVIYLKLFSQRLEEHLSGGLLISAVFYSMISSVSPFLNNLGTLI